VPDVRCDSADTWLFRVIDHGVETGHEEILWDDVVGLDYGIRCSQCDTRFLIGSYELRSETFVKPASSYARVLANGLQTQDGRKALVEGLIVRIKENRLPRTAWDRVLADDD
jgi:hypothetical protein